MAKSPSGKGGNFDTRVNPFARASKVEKSRPNFTEVSNLGQALQVCVEAGCALMLGSTRDGGAMVLTILDGDDRHRTYCSNDVELQEAFDAIVDRYEKM